MAYENLIAPGWTYGLEFVPPNKKRAPAELVFKTSAKHAARIERRLEERPELTDSQEYFGKELAFFLPGGREGAQSAFQFAPQQEFGFGGCGYVTTDEQEVAYHFPLIRAHVRRTTASISVLMMMLNGLLAEARDDKAPPSNRKQIFELSAFVRPGESMYGHPVGGEVFAPMRRWLKELAGNSSQPAGSIFDHRPLPKPVLDALRTTWAALAWDSAKRYAKECGGYLSGDGRFSLVCFGNACDVAMYPDGQPHDEAWPYRVSCHNLDGPEQQLTLLAGLAALYGLAAKELEEMEDGT